MGFNSNHCLNFTDSYRQIKFIEIAHAFMIVWFFYEILRNIENRRRLSAAVSTQI